MSVVPGVAVHVADRPAVTSAPARSDRQVFAWLRSTFPWQEHARARGALLRAQRPSDLPPLVAAQFDRLLAEAEELSTVVVWPWHRWRGGMVDRAWMNLHAAEVLLVRHGGRGPADSTRVLSAVSRHLPPDDVVRRRLEDRMTGTGAQAQAAGGLCEDLAYALSYAHDSSDAAFAQARSFRNTVLLAALATGVFAWLVVALSAAGLTSSSVPSSPGAVELPTAPLALLVLGSAGALLAGVASLQRVRGTTTPYGVPAALIVLKVATGGLSAVVGVVLLQSGLGGPVQAPTTYPALFGWAVVFGASQQLVTRLVDKQAQTVLDKV